MLVGAIEDAMFAGIAARCSPERDYDCWLLLAAPSFKFLPSLLPSDQEITDSLGTCEFGDA